MTDLRETISNSSNTDKYSDATVDKIIQVEVHIGTELFEREIQNLSDEGYLKELFK